MVDRLDIKVKETSSPSRNLSDLGSTLERLKGITSVEFIQPKDVEGFYRIKGTDFNWTSIHKEIRSSGYRVSSVLSYSEENCPDAIKSVQKQK
ncbi:MAG: hypothetical protein KKA64_03365 [Nanoarchaeota archaeon]|nr:hypothetical protein [Nanoarchaeota archaeon]